MPMRMMPRTTSTTAPITPQRNENQNVRMSHVRWDSTHVPRASSRFT